MKQRSFEDKPCWSSKIERGAHARSVFALHVAGADSSPGEVMGVCLPAFYIAGPV